VKNIVRLNEARRSLEFWLDKDDALFARDVAGRVAETRVRIERVPLSAYLSQLGDA
jgi:hypothetical protein